MFKTTIGNIPVDCFQDIEQAAGHILSDGTSKIAVAINPEKILASLTNESVKDALMSADIRYLDGIGAVKLAESRLGQKLSRIPGCELWESLMIESPKYGKSVFLLGATDSVVNTTKDKLISEYGVNVVGVHDGFFKDEKAMVEKLLELKPDILTVAMGSPRQELFMQKCRDSGLESFMMGVGGTYNVFVGAADRAPESWRKLNLEWLYRLVKEPSRIWRQLKLIKFIWLALLNRL